MDIAGFLNGASLQVMTQTCPNDELVQRKRRHLGYCGRPQLATSFRWQQAHTSVAGKQRWHFGRIYRLG
jgi:hypothetical protein